MSDNSFVVFFAPQSAKLDAAALAALDGLVATLRPASNISAACDGYTQYGSSHGADLRLSTRRAKAVCEFLDTRLVGAFVPTGHGKAMNPIDSARHVHVSVSFDLPADPVQLAGFTSVSPRSF